VAQLVAAQIVRGGDGRLLFYLLLVLLQAAKSKSSDHYLKPNGIFRRTRFDE
jgi:hypothetical protein